MKAEFTIPRQMRSEIVLPHSKRSLDAVVYAFPPRDVIVATHKITQDIYAKDYCYSTKLVLNIPGAAIGMPVIRLRVIGDLSGLTMANAATMNMHDFYYIEE